MKSNATQFSEREKEVTELLLQGKSNKQIALALGISASTVEYHLNNIYKKLQVSSRTEAVLRLGKSIGSEDASELGKPTVETNGESTDNGLQPISPRRISMNKTVALIGGGIVIVALVASLIAIVVFTNMPVPSIEGTPTGISSLPDLAITSAYVSMIDNNGTCLSYYGLNVTVVNQGNAPAFDVMLTDNTGQEVGIGDLNPLQSMSMSFVANPANGAYIAIVDPRNVIMESNESNNNATFSDATATPFAPCLTPQATPTTVFELPAATTPQAVSSTLSMEILRNATYRSPDWGEFQLSDGIYYRTPPTSQESPEAYTTRLLDTVLYGDINQDGLEDAVVFLATQSGGTGTFIEMAAVLNLDGSPVNISTEYLGDRVIVESGTVEGGLITLTLRVQGPNDPLCCPSKIEVRSFFIDANN
ncbi:MAG: LuxR C-terminal-related transcriptional regulator [Anaerolineales bacterium]